MDRRWEGTHFRIINCYKILNKTENILDIVFEAFKIDVPNG